MADCVLKAGSTCSVKQLHGHKEILCDGKAHECRIYMSVVNECISKSQSLADVKEEAESNV